MSDLTFNKIAGAVLATGLAIVGLRELSAGVFAPEEVTKPGYAVEVVEEGGDAAAPELPIVMMSGRASLSDAVRATKLGAFHFLEKPLSPEAPVAGAPVPRDEILK